MGLEQYSKAIRETAENLRIIDDALFRLMAERPGVCQEILGTLLDKPGLRVIRVTAQSVVKSLHREIALHNNQTVTHVKRCMQTADGYVPVFDKEDIFFANTAVKDDSDKSELLQLLLRKDVFEDDRYSELSKAMKYFKQTEGGRSEVCKTVEDYARNYARDYAMQERSEERLDAICRMIKKNYSKEDILDLGYSEKEYEKAEQGMLIHA